MNNQNKEKLKEVILKIKTSLKKGIEQNSFTAEMKLSDLEEHLIWMSKYNIEDIMYANGFLACLPDIVFHNYTDKEYEREIEWQQEQLENEGENIDNISLSGIYKYKYDETKTLDILLNFDFDKYFMIK